MRTLGLDRKRAKEILKIVTALSLLLLAIPILVRAGSAGWRNGVLFAMADALDVVLPGNVDVPVVIFAGLIGGWLLMFAVDTTKRIQTIALLPVALLTIVQLGDLDHIVDAVGREPLYFILGMIVSLSVTILTTNQLFLGPDFKPRDILHELRILHFPSASRAIFVAISILITVIMLQYPFISKTGNSPPYFRVLLSGIVSISALGFYTQYTSRTDVIMLTPDTQTGERLQLDVFGGLFRTAQSKYYARPVDQHSEDVLMNALRGGGLQFQGNVRFRYLSQTLLRRVIEVNSVEHQLSEFSKDKIEGLKEITSDTLWPLSQGIRQAAWKLKLFIPSNNISAGDGTIETIRSADTVLLVVPFPEEPPADSSVAYGAHLFRIIKEEMPYNVKLIIAHADRAEATLTNGDSNQSGDDVEKYDFDSISDRQQIIQTLIEMTDQDTEQDLSHISINYPERVLPTAGTAASAFRDARGFEQILEEIGE